MDKNDILTIKAIVEKYNKKYASDYVQRKPYVGELLPSTYGGISFYLQDLTSEELIYYVRIGGMINGNPEEVRKQIIKEVETKIQNYEIKLVEGTAGFFIKYITNKKYLI